MATIGAAITAVGGWVPPYRLTNQELEKLVDTNDEWIRTRTGIRERRILKGEGQGTSVMATKAVEELCQKRNLDPAEIDAVICATISPDMLFPCTANLVCEAVGAKNALSFDMLAACSGFIYALETGANYIRSGLYKKVVVIGADKMSATINYQDRETCVIFGDGAGAVLLEPNDEGLGVIDAILRTDASGKDLIFLRGGGSAHPMTEESVRRGDQYFKQDGRAVFKHAVTRMADAAEQMMVRHGLSSDDVAYLVPHQANQRIIKATAERMGVDMSKVLVNIDRYGNTTGGTIPLCLWDWETTFKKGDNLILAAFGGGFTWGSIYLKWAYDARQN
ncbi:3-oxoacyl-[acyl-carrier-protein] synthase-3 [Catalinimonas alkaloidigena]|uniref:Beta-ketoacyl-[acyl-carrier-protein] synthase III n=1 Tax=Catalinimonas alkaloidigena TaxID=1075417 RepID=A0A1G9D912_9BACT|nr:beta-ketoacyl-ACP synthase III [Catalinimonas alkaloidigena]SDK60333.1 3-oxoacyl-[acyl-carrier-protein] synthase-3 [Catalinimonas alkaloidigena]